MSVVSTNAPLSLFLPDRLLTIADVAALPSELPSGAVRYELDNGKLVVMPPAGDMHGAHEARLTYELVRQAEVAGHGVVRCGEVGIILRRNPDRLVGADAVFISKSRLPIQTSGEGYLETIPDLVAEVRSKNDRPGEVARKVAEYLAAGVRLVWVLDAHAQTVTVHRVNSEPQVLVVADSLTADDVIPGFSVALTELFKQ